MGRLHAIKADEAVEIILSRQYRPHSLFTNLMLKMPFLHGYLQETACLFMHDPCEPHLNLIKRIIRYLKGTLNLGLHLNTSTPTSLTACSDADCAGCPETRRSTSGFCVFLEIRTRIPDTVAWDYHFEHAGNTPVTFTVKSAILKESIDDLEWPGSSIQIHFHPDPPSVIFKGEGHGDLEIEFSYYANTDLLIAFQCDQELSYRYKYKFLRATTSNVPSSVLKENRGSKVTIGRGGMLKIQHLVSVARLGTQSYHNFAGGAQQPSRIAFIEFFVKPEEED
uniref:Putative mitochondrial protein n=1 Tax=Aegilops tauschii TaxID=37682 RepID=R7W980_AEGTA